MMYLFDVLRQAMADENWTFVEDQERGMVKLTIRGDNASYRVVVQVNEEKDLVSVFVFCPVNLPEDRRLAGAEFVARANFGLSVGNFELDMDDGEVRYRASVDIEGGELVPKMVTNMLNVSILTLDNYFPGIMAISYAGDNAHAAIAKIEGRETLGQPMLN